jgi:hypothetical protein
MLAPVPISRRSLRRRPRRKRPMSFPNSIGESMMRIRSNLGISDLAQMNSSDSSPILLNLTFNFIQMHLGVHTMTQATSSADNTTVTRFLGSTLRHGVNLLLVRRISPRATGHLVRGGILIRIEMLVLMIDSWYVTVTNVWTKT